MRPSAEGDGARDTRAGIGAVASARRAALHSGVSALPRIAGSRAHVWVRSQLWPPRILPCRAMRRLQSQIRQPSAHERSALGPLPGQLLPRPAAEHQIAISAALLERPLRPALERLSGQHRKRHRSNPGGREGRRRRLRPQPLARSARTAARLPRTRHRLQTGDRRLHTGKAGNARAPRHAGGRAPRRGERRSRHDERVPRARARPAPGSPRSAANLEAWRASRHRDPVHQRAHGAHVRSILVAARRPPAPGLLHA